jgi:hypothetical protein
MAVYVYDDGYSDSGGWCLGWAGRDAECGESRSSVTSGVWNGLVVAWRLLFCVLSGKSSRQQAFVVLASDN